MKNEDVVPPSISLVVIAYQEEERIGPCIAAIRAQDSPLDFEIIVVNDGSTDRTAEIVALQAREDPRVRLNDLGANRGRGLARQAGIDAATGNLLGFIDADIVIPPDWLTRLAAAVEHDDLVGGCAIPDGDIAAAARMSKATLKVRSGSIGVTGNNVLFRRDILQTVPFPQTRVGEDFRFVKRAIKAGYTQRVLSDLVVDHLETKSYRKSCTWMWELGVDSTRVLREFGNWRTPDEAWAAWLLGIIAALASTILGITDWIPAVLFALCLTGVIAVALASQRFALAPLGRFMVGAGLLIPLVGIYLVGRTWGLVRVLTGS